MYSPSRIYNLICDSSSEDDEILECKKPIFNIILHDDSEEDDVNDLVMCMHPVINGVQRIDRAKVFNYIENTVLKYTDVDFIMHFRLGRKLTYSLINRFAASMYFKSLNSVHGREILSPEKHILTFLWFCGHQTASYRDVADRFGITLSTLFAVITRVMDFLISMGAETITLPNAEEKRITEAHFRNNKKFMGVIGAIDGTQISIDRPMKDPDSYYTRKKTFAVHAQGLVNHQSEFLDVYVGYPGSVHDARVFQNSDLFPLLPQLCVGDEFILGDSAYPLMKNLIVPYRDNGHLTRKQKYFNTALSSCRIVVEHAFGQLKQRFRQLYHCKLRSMKRIVKLIYSCCILHNIADANDLLCFEPMLCTDPPDNNDSNVEIEIVYTDAAIKAYRDRLCDEIWNMRN